MLPIYLQIAHEFADLHDRSGRMLAKGVVRDVLEWKRSREFFYWRVRRRIAELGLRERVAAAGFGAALQWDEVTRLLQDGVGGPATWDDDRAFLEWVDSHQADVEAMVRSQRAHSAHLRIAELLDGLGDDEKRSVLDKLK
uniref:Acetyl-coenzyme A carboxylase carboxyl transferase subunit beta domain-containing protein n=1 Tax=Erythrolobus australicus TaxID=1077150 RepID=A0A7S1TNP5_9RHOD